MYHQFKSTGWKHNVIMSLEGTELEGVGRIQLVQDRSGNSEVGVATCYCLVYGLDSTGIESRWRRDFPFLSRPSLVLSLYNMHGVFSGIERPGRGVDHPPLSKAEVKERVEPYIYAPSGP